MSTPHFSLTHPFHAVKSILSLSKEYVFKLQSYIWLADSDSQNLTQFQNRRTRLFPAVEFTATKIKEFIVEAERSREDVVICSSICDDNDTLHIPMVDFITDNEADLKKFKEIETLTDFKFTDFAFYYSGKSFHAYGLKLLHDDGFADFIGALLLLNEEKPIVDTRWLGHALRRGEFCLRWTAVNERYKKLPTIIDVSDPGPQLYGRSI